MTQALAVSTDHADALERVLVHGDLARLSASQRTEYVTRLCQSLGLNPLSRPFQYLKLSGKEVLYATRDCTEQLRKLHRVAIAIVARERHEDVYVVTARATTPDGRTDESVGAVPIAGVKGESLANAIMKCETKAKRRVTLSICGLGMLDESEVDAIAGAKVVPMPPREVAVATGAASPALPPHDPETGEVFAPADTLESFRAELLAAKTHDQLEQLRQRIKASPLLPHEKEELIPAWKQRKAELSGKPKDDTGPLREAFAKELDEASSATSVARISERVAERVEAGELTKDDQRKLGEKARERAQAISQHVHHGPGREES